MTVKIMFFSDLEKKEPKTMYESKREADIRDRQLESIYELGAQLIDAAKEQGVEISEEQADAIAEYLGENAGDTLGAMAKAFKVKASKGGGEE